MSPPSRRTTCRQKGSPRPVPAPAPRSPTRRSKMRASRSAGRPGPSSAISATIFSPTRRTETTIRPSLRPARASACAALASRLMNTWHRAPGLPRTRAPGSSRRSTCACRCTTGRVMRRAEPMTSPRSQGAASRSPEWASVRRSPTMVRMRRAPPPASVIASRRSRRPAAPSRSAHQAARAASCASPAGSSAVMRSRSARIEPTVSRLLMTKASGLLISCATLDASWPTPASSSTRRSWLPRRSFSRARTIWLARVAAEARSARR